MANRLGIDPDKFKHVSSDDKMTVLRHKDGHELRIAHNILSPKMRSQLEALGKAAKDSETKDQKEEKQSDDDKTRQKFAEGTPEDVVQPVEDTKPQENPELDRKREIYNKIISTTLPTGDPMGAKAHMFGPNGEQPANFDAKTWPLAEQQYAQEKEQNAAQAQQSQQQAIALNQQRTAAGLPPVPVPNVPEGPSIPNVDNAAIQEAVAQQPQEQPKPAEQAPQMPRSPLEQAEQLQLQGAQQTAQAQSALGQQQAAILQKNADAKATAQKKFQESFDALDKERLQHIEDINKAQIDPNRYWLPTKEGGGGHSKIASAIGMIIAGFNPTSNPNAAMNMLKFQMENNLQAQKDNLGAKKTLLEANLRQFGNLKDATDMTRLMQADLVENDLKMAAANAQTPLAKAAALTAAGEIKKTYAPLHIQMALRQAMMNMAHGGGDPSHIEAMMGFMDAADPGSSKPYRERYIPGVGLASIPVPDKVREDIISHQKLSDAAQDMLQYSKTHTNLIPGTKEYNIGAQKAAILQQMVREGLLGTVFRESEKPLLNTIVDSNPAGVMKSISAQPKLRTLLESNIQQLEATKRNYGIPSNKAQERNPAASDIPEGATGMYKGKPVIRKNGAWVPR